jgi:hypothetical protein
MLQKKKKKQTNYLKVLPSPLEQSGCSFLLAELVVDGHQRLDHRHRRFPVKLVLLK